MLVSLVLEALWRDLIIQMCPHIFFPVPFGNVSHSAGWKAVGSSHFNIAFTFSIWFPAMLKLSIGGGPRHLRCCHFIQLMGVLKISSATDRAPKLGRPQNFPRCGSNWSFDILPLQNFGEIGWLHVNGCAWGMVFLCSFAWFLDVLVPGFSTWAHRKHPRFQTVLAGISLTLPGSGKLMHPQKMAGEAMISHRWSKAIRAINIHKSSVIDDTLW